MRLLTALVAAGAAPPSDDAKVWIVAGAIAVVVILLVVLPFAEKLREVIGKATAQPLIDAHDKDPKAHAEHGQAIALLNQSIEDLQRQINALDKVGKERLEAVQSKLQVAIDLLEKQ